MSLKPTYLDYVCAFVLLVSVALLGIRITSRKISFPNPNTCDRCTTKNSGNPWKTSETGAKVVEPERK